MLQSTLQCTHECYPTIAKDSLASRLLHGVGGAERVDRVSDPSGAQIPDNHVKRSGRSFHELDLVGPLWSRFFVFSLSLHRLWNRLACFCTHRDCNFLYSRLQKSGSQSTNHRVRHTCVHSGHPNRNDLRKFARNSIFLASFGLLFRNLRLDPPTLMQKIHRANHTRTGGLTRRLRSLQFALRGIAVLLRTQQNAAICLIFLFGVSILGLLLRIQTWEWCAIFLAAGGVFVSEGLNTSLEFLANVVSPEYNRLIRDAKDVAAASVLIAAFTALLIGIAIFGSRLLFHFEHSWQNL